MTKGKNPNYSPYSMAPQNLNWKRGQWLGGLRRMQILLAAIAADINSGSSGVPENLHEELLECTIRGYNLAEKADMLLRSIPKKGR